VAVQVLADTSFLMIPGSFKIDIFEEIGRVLGTNFEILVPSPVMAELRRLATSGSPRERSAAKVALDLIKDARVISKEGKADEVIIELAEREGVVVATTDLALRRKLRKRGKPVIYLRGGSHLKMDGTWRS